MVKLAHMAIFTEIIWNPEEKSSTILITFIKSQKLAHDFIGWIFIPKVIAQHIHIDIDSYLRE